jgi:hypothetical protein
MATIDLGRVGFVNKGTYSGVFAYKLNDVVVYNSGTYACIQANTGQLPTVTAYWQVWVANDKAPLDSPALVNPTINGVAQSGYTGFKNLLINGGFDVWQRGTTIVSTNEYTADRFITITSSPAITVAKTANGTTVEKIATSGYAVFAQMIESNKYMSGKTVTLSVKLKSISGGGKVDVRINGAAAKNSINSIYVPTFSEGATFNLTNDFITYIVTATLPTYTDEDYTVAVVFDLRDAYTGSTTDKIEIAQVQLEEGSVATPFEQRPYGLELSLCQRYYEICSFDLLGGSAANEFVSDAKQYVVQKRTVPTIGNVTVDYTRNVSQVVIPYVNTTNSFSCYVRSNFSDADGVDHRGSFTASAEL